KRSRCALTRRVRVVYKGQADHRRWTPSGLKDFPASESNMRRSAINFTAPAWCALLAVVLVCTIGKAEERGTARVPRARTPMAVGPAPLVRLPVSQRAELLHDLPSARAVVMEVTAYCPCPKCCGPDAQGITASGRRVSQNGGKFVAADTS